MGLETSGFYPDFYTHQTPVHDNPSPLDSRALSQLQTQLNEIILLCALGALFYTISYWIFPIHFWPLYTSTTISLITFYTKQPDSLVLLKEIVEQLFKPLFPEPEVVIEPMVNTTTQTMHVPVAKTPSPFQPVSGHPSPTAPNSDSSPREVQGSPGLPLKERISKITGHYRPEHEEKERDPLHLVIRASSAFGVVRPATRNQRPLFPD